jgi:hypothetical protein
MTAIGRHCDTLDRCCDSSARIPDITGHRDRPGDDGPAMAPHPPAPDAPRVAFACPLCLDAFGRTVIIVAELDLTTPLVTVADLSGCRHAQAFGAIGALTELQELQLITAALDAYVAERGGEGGGQRCAAE